MKAAAGTKAIIVYLNLFLSFWGKNTYSSNYFDNDQIKHVSLNRFAKMISEPETLVSFDEID